MNKNTFYIALAASCAFSGEALAATNASSTAALAALPTVDESWVISNSWTSIDSGKPVHTAIWDVPVTVASDPCGDNWAGIYCDAEDDDITHIEIPNAKMNGTLASVFSALAPIKAQLISINVSSTEAADKNVLIGSIPTDGTAIGYTALGYLGLNSIGASGDIPDLSSNSALLLANFYENEFTTYSGPVGGTFMHTLGLRDNPGMSGNLTVTLANSLALTTLSNQGTALLGGLNGAENVTAAAGVTADSLTITWSAPSEGVVPNSYLVDLSDDEGATWEDLPPVTGGSNTAAAAGLADGTYLARVTPKTNAGLIGSVQSVSDPVTLSSNGSGGTDGGTSGSTDTGAGSTDSSGGGAVFWLLALPLMGFARRMR